MDKFYIHKNSRQVLPPKSKNEANVERKYLKKSEMFVIIRKEVKNGIKFEK